MNIWESLEVECWARGYSYSGYVKYSQSCNNPGSVLSWDGYNDLCKLLDSEHKDSYK